MEAKTIRESIVGRIHIARRRAGVSVARLSRATGIGRTTLTKSLNSARDFTLAELFAIGHALGVSVKEFTPNHGDKQ